MSSETDEQPTLDETNVDDESIDGEVASAESDETLFGADDAAPAEEVSLIRIEALLFATQHPLTAGRLAELLDLPSTKPIRRAVQSLNDDYARTKRSFRIEQVAGGYQMLTLPELGELVKKLVQKETDAKLTKA